MAFGEKMYVMGIAQHLKLGQQALNMGSTCYLLSVKTANEESMSALRGLFST